MTACDRFRPLHSASQGVIQSLSDQSRHLVSRCLLGSIQPLIPNTQIFAGGVLQDESAPAVNLSRCSFLTHPLGEILGPQVQISL